MREALTYFYSAITDGRDAETRADIDAVLIGETPPSERREWEANQARAWEMARAGEVG